MVVWTSIHKGKPVGPGLRRTWWIRPMPCDFSVWIITLSTNWSLTKSNVWKRRPLQAEVYNWVWPQCGMSKWGGTMQTMLTWTFNFLWNINCNVEILFSLLRKCHVFHQMHLSSSWLLSQSLYSFWSAFNLFDHTWHDPFGFIFHYPAFCFNLTKASYRMHMHSDL